MKVLSSRCAKPGAAGPRLRSQRHDRNRASLAFTWPKAQKISEAQVIQVSRYGWWAAHAQQRGMPFAPNVEPLVRCVWSRVPVMELMDLTATHSMQIATPAVIPSTRTSTRCPFALHVSEDVYQLFHCNRSYPVPLACKPKTKHIRTVHLRLRLCAILELYHDRHGLFQDSRRHLFL